MELSAHTPPFPGRARERLCAPRSLNSSLMWELQGYETCSDWPGILLHSPHSLPQIPRIHSADVQLSV